MRLVRRGGGVELLADRFVVTDAGRTIDLATADAVVVMTAAAGGPTDERRWAVRCDAWRTLRHARIAQLVDFGGLGESERFEAWRCGAPWNGAREIGDDTARVAHRFLRASGLTSGTLDVIRQWRGGAVVLPDSAAGYPIDADSRDEDDAVSLDMCGVGIVPRREMAALAELFETTAGSAPRIASIWGPPGVGKSTVVAELARIARLRGFVPISARLWRTGTFAAVLAGRSLFLIDEGESCGWEALLDSALRDPKPHVLLHVGIEDVRGVDGVALGRLEASTLADSIRPSELPDGVRARVRRAADRADGLPGRFLRLLRPDAMTSDPPRAPATRRTSIAAEQPVLYGGDELERAPDLASPGRPEWPAPGELAALRRRLTSARESIDGGRHASGERALRQTTGMLARRGDWIHAREGALTLASCLLRRGRAREALAAIEDGRQYGQRVDDGAAAADAAVLAGVAWTDLGRLDEAESVLAAALASARAGDDSSAIVQPSLALARCFFWRGRYSEARELINRATTVGVSDATAVSAAVQASRVAVGLGDAPRAVALANEALDRARTIGDARVLAQAAYGSSFAHLASGDLDGVDRDIAECLSAVRSTHDPLKGLRARLLAAESARRRGRRASAERVARRLASLSAARVPPVVRARCALLKDLTAGSAATAVIVARHVAATGLQALALFAPSESAHDCPSHDVSGLLDILRLCQTADDERSVLVDICGRLRRQLRAAAVAFVVRDQAALATLASEGNRIDHLIAGRAADSGIVIAPHRCEDRIEAAAPVKYGGTTIGALVARWALGSGPDTAGATAALTMASTAAAPIVAAALASRAAPAPAASSELIGTSGAIDEVRRAIARAARAPFAVLIEGESGAGKELVARALHRGGGRRDRPFCAMNCAALPDDLVEAELFGHARGAFTGAVADRPGVFEEAHGGTLLLDEIGELSLRAQAKLLRVIQDGDLRRVGENVSRRVDVRIVAATNRDLRAEAAAARFRVDLLYRLDVIRILVPPLRERREDIAALAEHFWREAAARVGSRATLAAATMAALARYDWPGNVRELQNVLAALAVRSSKRGVVPPDALPPIFGESRGAETWRLDEARRTFETRFVRAALSRAGGQRARAALELGVTRQGLTKLMNRLGIE